MSSPSSCSENAKNGGVNEYSFEAILGISPGDGDREIKEKGIPHSLDKSSTNNISPNVDDILSIPLSPGMSVSMFTPRDEQGFVSSLSSPNVYTLIIHDDTNEEQRINLENTNGEKHTYSGSEDVAKEVKENLIQEELDIEKTIVKSDSGRTNQVNSGSVIIPDDTQEKVNMERQNKDSIICTPKTDHITTERIIESCNGELRSNSPISPKILDNNNSESIYSSQFKRDIHTQVDENELKVKTTTIKLGPDCLEDKTSQTNDLFSEEEVQQELEKMIVSIDNKLRNSMINRLKMSLIKAIAIEMRSARNKDLEEEILNDAISYLNEEELRRLQNRYFMSNKNVLRQEKALLKQAKKNQESENTRKEVEIRKKRIIKEITTRNSRELSAANRQLRDEKLKTKKIIEQVQAIQLTCSDKEMEYEAKKKENQKRKDEIMKEILRLNPYEDPNYSKPQMIEIDLQVGEPTLIKNDIEDKNLEINSISTGSGGKFISDGVLDGNNKFNHKNKDMQNGEDHPDNIDGINGNKEHSNNSQGKTNVPIPLDVLQSVAYNIRNRHIPQQGNDDFGDDSFGSKNRQDQITVLRPIEQTPHGDNQGSTTSILRSKREIDPKSHVNDKNDQYERNMELRKIQTYFRNEALEFEKFSNQEQVYVPDGPVGDKLEKALPSLFKLWDRATTSFGRRNMFIEKIKEYLSDDMEDQERAIENNALGIPTRGNMMTSNTRYKAALVMTQAELKSLNELLTKYGTEYRMIRKREELKSRLKKLKSSSVDANKYDGDSLAKYQEQYDLLTNKLKEIIEKFHSQGFDLLYRGYPYISILNITDDLM